MANRWRNSDRFYIWGAPKSLQMVTEAMKLRDTCSLEKIYDQLRQHIKKQRHYFANKGPSSQSFGFSSSHVRMWELDHRKGWAPKDWCFQTVVLEKIESPLKSKEIKPVNPKGNQPWIFMERLMLKLKLQYFGHLIWRANSLENTLMLLKIDGKLRRGWRRMK